MVPAKNAFFEPSYTEYDPFTKTVLDRHQKKGVFRRELDECDSCVAGRGQDVLPHGAVEDTLQFFGDAVVF